MNKWIKLKTRNAGDKDPKLYLQNSVNFWDPASKGGDETQITHLPTFLEHHTKSKHTKQTQTGQGFSVCKQQNSKMKKLTQKCLVLS